MWPRSPVAREVGEGRVFGKRVVVRVEMWRAGGGRRAGQAKARAHACVRSAVPMLTLARPPDLEVLRLFGKGQRMLPAVVRNQRLAPCPRARDLDRGQPAGMAHTRLH